MPLYSDYLRAIAGFLTLRFDKGGSPPAAPPPPDPANTIRAQAAATPSAFTPYGSRVYSGDPNVPGQFKYTESFSPELQNQFDARNRLTQSVLGRTEQQLPNLSPEFVQPGMESQGTQQYWNTQKKMLNDVFDRDEDRLDQKLSNQGLPIGSEAYNDEQNRFAQSRSDAYDRAATNAQQVGFGQSLQARQQAHNELASALGGQQLNPVSGGAGSFVDPTAALQAYQQGQGLQHQSNVAGYNANVAQNNAMLGTAGTLGAAAIGAMMF